MLCLNGQSYMTHTRTTYTLAIRPLVYAKPVAVLKFFHLIVCTHRSREYLYICSIGRALVEWLGLFTKKISSGVLNTRIFGWSLGGDGGNSSLPIGFISIRLFVKHALYTHMQLYYVRSFVNCENYTAGLCPSSRHVVCVCVCGYGRCHSETFFRYMYT